MTQQLFTWKRWDQLDLLGFTFTDCTILKAFGPFAIGDKLAQIIVDFDAGTISVPGMPWAGKLTLTVEAA